MKLIIAIIQPHNLESVKQALTDVEVFRLTIMDCQGFGRQGGKSEGQTAGEFVTNLRRKVQLQIAVNDEFVEPTIAAIIKGGRSGDQGEIGDSKIFILPLDDVVRIRTGERGRRFIPTMSNRERRHRFLSSRSGNESPERRLNFRAQRLLSMP
ncbi:MAG: P-II family nitrogen regulator [Pirellulaceae bacterium]